MEARHPGAAWPRLKKRLGIAGHIIALEFTRGDQNGWHPHHHVLLVHDQDLDATAIAALHAHIHTRLAAACRDHGLRAPGQLHAVRIDANVSATAAGAYIAKGSQWTPAEEMTRGDLKNQAHRLTDTVPDPRRLLPDRRHTRPRPLARIRARHPQPRRRPLVSRPP